MGKRGKATDLGPGHPGCNLERVARAGARATATLLHGETDQAIATHAVAAGINRLVRGGHGHGRIRNMVLVSTSTALPRKCRILVPVFR